MPESTRDITKKRKPRAEQIGTPVLVRLQPDQLGKLDAWITRQPEPRPTRPEAIRRLIEFGLKTKVRKSAP
jgi:hypothetical protein